MLQLQEPRGTRESIALSVSLARDADEMAEAQRLRYQIFTRELGARLANPIAGLDSDAYDAHCDHLLVRDGACGEVIATYRILTGVRAQTLGGFYADSEFDLARFAHLRPAMAEIGRSCVHPDYRSGTAIGLLWRGIGRYLEANDCRYLIGCASVGLSDGGHCAASLYNRLRQTSMSPREYRVFPRRALPLATLNGALQAVMPPLIKGYLRAGAWVCGAPAWDAEFNTADLLMLLPLDRLDARYARHFLRRERTDGA